VPREIIESTEETDGGLLPNEAIILAMINSVANYALGIYKGLQDLGGDIRRTYISEVLERLEFAGYLESHYELPKETPEGKKKTGRMRRVFSLTEKGNAVLRVEKARMKTRAEILAAFWDDEFAVDRGQDEFASQSKSFSFTPHEIFVLKIIEKNPSTYQAAILQQTKDLMNPVSEARLSIIVKKLTKQNYIIKRRETDEEASGRTRGKRQLLEVTDAGRDLLRVVSQQERTRAQALKAFWSAEGDL